MKEIWISRSRRERILLIVACALFAAGAVYTLIVSPLGQWRSDAGQRVLYAEETYNLVTQATAKAVGTTSSSGDRDAFAPIRSTLNQSARANGVSLNFVNQRSDGNVEASVDAIDPDALFRWLQELDARYAIAMQSVDIIRENASGPLVRAQIVFGRN